MAEPRSNQTASPSDLTARKRTGLLVRVVLFAIVVIACGFYSRIFQRLWTTVFPLACSTGSTAPLFVDFDAFPARIGDQDNLCRGVGDGECQRSDGDDVVRGECLGERMHGRFSVVNAKAGARRWSGTYCDGLPCGEFRIRIDSEHENVFRVENLHIQGPATIWERDGDRFVEFSGRYDRGKRVGRWVRRVEPSKTVRMAVIYDEHGIMTTASMYCTNGNLKEIRGKRTFIFDPQGKTIAEGSVLDPATGAGAANPSLCPLP
ncbi:MAG: hypothetical protein IPM54_22610 [Polyangiaceae bacterium]|nr:hypothetical protein [Polyangiaceae bacterium]